MSTSEEVIANELRRLRDRVAALEALETIGTGGGGGLLVPRTSGSAVFALDCSSTGLALSIANNASAQVSGGNNFAGLLILNETAVNGGVAVFAIGGAGGIVKMADTLNVYSTTSGTASKINVFLLANVLTIENKLGSTASINALLFRTRATL